MSGQDDYVSGQNLGLAVILTGHLRGLQNSYKIGRGFFQFFSNTEEKISVFENIRIRVDRALAFFEKLKVFTTTIASNVSRKLI